MIQINDAVLEEYKHMEMELSALKGRCRLLENKIEFYILELATCRLANEQLRERIEHFSVQLQK